MLSIGTDYQIVKVETQFEVGRKMAAVSGISSFGGYSAVQGVGRPNSVRGPRLPDNATFEQDLLQSGLNANVSTDELLKSVQSSIKTAINDPSNSGKDFFDVIQTAVQKTLKENGVDTEKLTSLLQSQIPDQAGLNAYGEGSLPDRLYGDSGVGSKEPPPAGGHQLAPRPNDVSEASDQSLLSVLDDLDEDDSGTQSTSKATKTKSAQAESGFNASSNAADNVASQFKRLISDLIKSLPSGTTLDVQA